MKRKTIRANNARSIGNQKLPTATTPKHNAAKLKYIFAGDESPICVPLQYPVEMVDLDDVYIVQMSCFRNEGYTNGEQLLTTRFAAENEKEVITPTAMRARIFEDLDGAIDYARKECERFGFNNDGNVYPRVLKVRFSCTVKEVAFNAVINDREYTEKSED